MPDSCVAVPAAAPVARVASRLARAVAAALAIATVWTGVRLGLAARFGIPGPVVHDEFSYLLGADTFAHGRLVNPPHAMAEFFESAHILLHPVYASKFPPGQSLFLAFGQRFLGSPFYGVVAGGAFMIFTVSLMLSVWVPSVWSGIVTALLAIYLLPPMYWANSYWGGCVAAGGGALVMLAIGLYRRNRPALAGWIFGLGAMVLFLTRPYEGGVFTLAALLIYRTVFHRKSILVAAASATPLILAGLLWTAHYNRMVTGSALEFPEQLYDQQYDAAPLFWILPLRPDRAYSHPRLTALHGIHGYFAEQYRGDHPWWIGLSVGLITSFLHLAMLVGPVAGAALIIPWIWRDVRIRRLATILGILMAALSIEAGHLLHYAAPGAGAVAILVALSLEKSWQFRLKTFPIGRVSVIALIFFAIGSSLIHLRTADNKPDGADRVELIHRLQALGKSQLVFVHYPSPDWNVLRDWVYNGADIDRQAVVFAQDLGSKEDARLLAYYPNRQAWLLSMQDSGYRLDPYPR